MILDRLTCFVEVKFTEADAQKVFAELFAQPRDARSDAYKWGVRAGISFKMLGQRISAVFTEGTAESDAWFAGLEEGRRVGAQQCQVLK